MASGNTVHGRRVNISLGVDLLGDLGWRLVGSGRKQTTLEQTTSDVTRSLCLLGRARRHLADLRAAEQSRSHGRKLKLLLDLLDDLGVGFEDSLLSDKGRVRGVCHLDNSRLDLLDGAAAVTKGDGDGLAGVVGGSLVFDILSGSSEAVAGVGVGSSANIKDVSRQSSRLVVGRRWGVLLGGRGRNILAHTLRGESIGQGALDRRFLLLGRGSRLDRRLGGLAVALVEMSTSGSLLGGGLLGRHLVACADRRKSRRVF